MTSVLNVGVMTRNPVGNQIRSLQAQLDAEKKVVQLLLTALESKSPDVFAEYSSLKAQYDESLNPQGQGQNQNQFQGQFQNQNQNQNQNQGQRSQQGGGGSQATRNPNARF